MKVSFMVPENIDPIGNAFISLTRWFLMVSTPQWLLIESWSTQASQETTTSSVS
jgi:hypothetical protein